MTATVAVARRALDAVVRHARAAAPHECCGLLVGSAGVVEEAVPAGNVESSPTRYRVDPRDHFALIRRLRGSGRTIVGAYHSHPAGTAAASAADVREAFDATFLYLIVGLATPDRPDIAAYVFVEGRADAVAIAMRD